MPVPCNLIKPYTLILSVDKHDAILVGALPPIPSPVPALFSNVKWVSLNTVYWPSCDDHSPDVNADAHPIYKRDHAVKNYRVHVMLPPVPEGPPVPPVLPPWAPPAVTDLGLIVKHIYNGNSKCRFGPFSVKGNITAPGDPVGVINIPWSPIGLLNSESCGALALGMAIIDVPSPNSVVAGMSLGDYLGCIALIAIDRFTDWLKGKFDGLPDWAKDYVVNPLIDGLNAALGEAVSQFLVPAVDIAVARYTDGPLGDLLGPAVAPAPIAVSDASAAVTQAFADAVVDAETKAVKKAMDKALPGPTPKGLDKAVDDQGKALKDRAQRRINEHFGVPDGATRTGT
jgi:hypothetical protein